MSLPSEGESARLLDGVQAGIGRTSSRKSPPAVWAVFAGIMTGWSRLAPNFAANLVPIEP